MWAVRTANDSFVAAFGDPWEKWRFNAFFNGISFQNTIFWFPIAQFPARSENCNNLKLWTIFFSFSIGDSQTLILRFWNSQIFRCCWFIVIRSSGVFSLPRSMVCRNFEENFDRVWNLNRKKNDSKIDNGKNCLLLSFYCVWHGTNNFWCRSRAFSRLPPSGHSSMSNFFSLLTSLTELIGFKYQSQGQAEMAKIHFCA